MTEEPRLSWFNLVLFVLVVAGAAAVRVWYLQTCLDVASADPLPFVAQDPSPAVTIQDGGGKPRSTTAQELLIKNLAADNNFATVAPLSDAAEETAHVSPGHPWLVALLRRVVDEGQDVALIRWLQCGLGALTAGFYFFFARRAFRSVPVALLAGLLCAAHPFWVVNTAELGDGVLATFLLAATLMFGTRAGETGDTASSLLFGLALAGATLVRAALLPFAAVGLLWFLVRTRNLERGWLCGLLGVLGFVNGVAPWTVRNFQTFDEAVPIVDSAFVHLWQGNNRSATGGPQDEETLRAALPEGRLDELLAVESQTERYQMLAHDVADYVADHPAETVRRRLQAGLYFFLGEGWFRGEIPGENPSSGNYVPDWLRDNYAVIVNGTLLGMLVLGLLGWRWTYGWRGTAALSALALLWVPVPYVLGHAETLWGPRLPLDGVLLSYAAFALVYLLPGLGRNLVEGTGDV